MSQLVLYNKAPQTKLETTHICSPQFPWARSPGPPLPCLGCSYGVSKVGVSPRDPTGDRSYSKLSWLLAEFNSLQLQDRGP